MEFSYKGKNRQNQSFDGTISAKSRKEAIELLRRRGILSLQELKEERDSASWLEKAFNPRPKTWDLFLFFRQLAAFQATGESVNKAMDLISKQTRNRRLKEAINEVRRDVEGGMDIAGAIEKQDVFPIICARLIRPNEEAGSLEAGFREVALYLKQSGDTQEVIKTVMLEIGFLMALMAGCVCTLIFFLIPKFQGLYVELGIELPLPTRIVFGIYDFVTAFWYLVIAGVAGAIYFHRWYKRTYPLRYDGMFIKVPVYKLIYRNVLMYRFCKTFWALRKAGVNYMESLTYAGEAMGNIKAQNILQQARTKIQDGAPLAVAIRDSDPSSFFDYIAINFLATGESSGKTEELLADAAEYYSEMTKTESARFQTMIKPFVLVPMAGIVLFIMLATYLPMISIYSGIKSLSY